MLAGFHRVFIALIQYSAWGAVDLSNIKPCQRHSDFNPLEHSGMQC